MLSHTRHTGRKLPHYRTSYAGLFFVLLICGLVLGAITWSTLASPTVSVGAVVPYAPPAGPPTITSPPDGAKFTSSPVDVAGSCQSGLVVEIFRNSVFAGSAACSGGQFSIKVDLEVGSNRLVAKHITPDEQESIDSNSVNIEYVPPALTQKGASSNTSKPPVASSAHGLSSSVSMLQITIQDRFYLQQNGEVTVRASIAGGSPPYALSIDWGDGSTELFSVARSGQLAQVHEYKKNGNYTISFQVSDSQNQKASAQVAVIVQDQAAAAGTLGDPADQAGRLLIVWPFYVVITLMALSFWLGEKHEKFLLAAAKSQG